MKHSNYGQGIFKTRIPPLPQGDYLVVLVVEVIWFLWISGIVILNFWKAFFDFLPDLSAFSEKILLGNFES